MRNTIRKYLDGNLANKGQQELLNWLRKDNHHAEFESIKKEWWLEKKSREQVTDFRKNSLLERINEKKRFEQTSRQNQFYKYAAAILLIVSIASSALLSRSFFTNTKLQLTEIRTEFGQISSVVLPDSSIVWINSGTKLSYNNQYGINNRDISVEGEAFFSVSKNEAIPFHVELGKMRVEVTGTQFSVSNYPSCSVYQVILEEGSVNVFSKKNRLMAKLKPNEMARLNTEKKVFKTKKVNPEHFNAWRFGIIHIYELTLEELVSKLERRYNQKFQVDPRISKLPYTFTIKDEKLSDVINLLEKISPLEAVQDEDIIKLNYKPN